MNVSFLNEIFKKNEKCIKTGFIGLGLDEKQKGSSKMYLLSEKDFYSIRNQRMLVVYCLVDNFTSSKRELEGLMNVGNDPENFAHSLFNKNFFNQDLEKYNNHLKWILKSISNNFDSNKKIGKLRLDFLM